MSSISNDSHWQQFGKWLKQKRLLANLTQTQVGNRAGITDVQVARIEKGESGTKRETVISLAQAIGIDSGETLNKAGFDIPKNMNSINFADSDSKINNKFHDLEGVQITFDEKKIPKHEQEKILNVIRVLANQAKAENQQ